MKRRTAFFAGIVAVVGLIWSMGLFGSLKQFITQTIAQIQGPIARLATVPPQTTPTSTEVGFTGDRTKPYTLALHSGEGARALDWRLTVNHRVTGYAYASSDVYEVDGEVVTSTDALVFTAYQPNGEKLAHATGTWMGPRLSGTVRFGSNTSTLSLTSVSTTDALISFRRMDGRWTDAKRSLGCTYSLVLPTVEVGHGVSSAAATKINQVLRDAAFQAESLMLMNASKTSVRTVEQARDRYLADCRSELQQEAATFTPGDMASGGFERALETSVMVPFNQNGWVSFVFDVYSYTGGAHGSNPRIALTFNTKTGDVIPLQNLMRKESQVVFGQRLASLLLRQYAEELLDDQASQMRVFVNAPAQQAQTLWKTGQSGISSSTTLFLVPNGMEAVFQQYEVAPYAVGLPQIFLPYAKWKDLVGEGVEMPF
ncbi:DUF3298 and DUF4163 domain-containing protein [Patescibacteria group bacterium]|nr:DUF3298 and DUF4163 domain-containing protein [Patescibacteria group bacterium]